MSLSNKKPAAEFVKELHEASSIQPEPVILHPKRYQNFQVECGRFPGQKVLVHIYNPPVQAPRFVQMLEERFANNMFPVQVTHHPGVIAGNAQDIRRDAGTNSFCLLWDQDLPAAMLTWIRKKIQAMDDDLTLMRQAR